MRSLNEIMDLKFSLLIFRHDDDDDDDDDDKMYTPILY